MSASMPILKAAAVVSVMPVWARIDTITALTGVPDNTVRRLYNTDKVRAKKCGDTINSACVFRVQDVLDWLDEEAVKPEKFQLPQAKKEEVK